MQTAPVETSLHSDDLRSAAQVWSEMFDNAKNEIVIGQFYADKPPPKLILISEDVPEQNLLEDALSDRAGHRVRVETPARGDKRAPVERPVEPT